jgi:hypothetical protein
MLNLCPPFIVARALAGIVTVLLDGRGVRGAPAVVACVLYISTPSNPMLVWLVVVKETYAAFSAFQMSCLVALICKHSGHCSVVATISKHTL